MKGRGSCTRVESRRKMLRCDCSTGNVKYPGDVEMPPFDVVAETSTSILFLKILRKGVQLLSPNLGSFIGLV